MADYWKSQPRHFCDYCKCWIADNKPSREFHEKGKNHQKNVKLKIDQVRKKGVEDALKKEEMSDALREMEEAAIRSLKKDLTQDPSMASLYGVKLKSKESKKEETMIGPCNKPDGESADAPAECDLDWQEAWTPEGYVYYWNSKGDRTWEKPEGYIPSWERALEVEKALESQGEENPKEVETASETEEEGNMEEASVSESPEVEPSSSTEDLQEQQQPEEVNNTTLVEKKDVHMTQPPSIEDIPLPPTKCDAASEGPTPAKMARTEDQEQSDPEHDEPRGPKPVPQHWAYGAWQSVKTEEAAPVDLQLPILPEEPALPDVPAAIPEEPKIKFRQKKVDTLGQELVAFRKRKMNARLQEGLRKKDADS